MNTWYTIGVMPEGVMVMTKIDDANGIRNVQKLKRRGNLFFGGDGTYVYYTPTHWRELKSGE